MQAADLFPIGSRMRATRPRRNELGVGVWTTEWSEVNETVKKILEFAWKILVDSNFPILSKCIEFLHLTLETN